MEAHERRALPEGWGTVALPEIVFFQEGPGVRKHQFTTEGIKLINVGNLANNELVLDKTETYISTEEATTKYKHFLVDEGDLIIASSGIKVDYFHKKIAFAKKEHLPLCMNTSTIRFKPLNKNKISMKFFRYFIMTPFFTKQVQFHITGSAQLNFGPSHLEKMEVVLPPLEIQNKIVLLLEKAEETKKLRAQADELTDRLLQSVFIEMFGDLVTNPKKWIEGKLGDFFSDIRYGVSIKSSSKGYPIIGMNSVSYDGRIDWNDLSKVELSPDTFRKEKLEKYDILFNRTNASNLVGKTGIVDKEIDAVAASYLIRLRIKPSFQPYFVWYLMNSPFLKAIFCQKCKKAVNQANINSKELAAFPAIFPPLPLQQKFARIVEKIESMRQSQNQSKQQIEDLFSTLMQKAFRGEI